MICSQSWHECVCLCDAHARMHAGLHARTNFDHYLAVLMLAELVLARCTFRRRLHWRPNIAPRYGPGLYLFSVRFTCRRLHRRTDMAYNRRPQTYVLYLALQRPALTALPRCSESDRASSKDFSSRSNMTPARP